MHRLPFIIVTAALLAAMAVPVAAHPRRALRPPVTVDLLHRATDNIVFHARVAEHVGTAGGGLAAAGTAAYVVTDPRGVWTYDVSRPTSPTLLDVLPLAQGTNGQGLSGTMDFSYPIGIDTMAAHAQEDPTVASGTFVVQGTGAAGEGRAHVVSVTDPEAITSAATTGSDHTWTCISDVTTGAACRYAWGAGDPRAWIGGEIIDLTDPSTPVTREESWLELAGADPTVYRHDLTEIRPGLVMSVGAHVQLLDTSDPLAPALLVDMTPDELGKDFASSTLGGIAAAYHQALWPMDGNAKHLILGTEVSNSGQGDGTASGEECSDEAAVIETWDASQVLDALSRMQVMVDDGVPRSEARAAVFGDGSQVDFTHVDTYQASTRGIFLDGDAPGNVLFCAHWFSASPAFDATGGTIAAGYYNRGVRFIDLAEDGTMSERGWFVGADAYASSAQWVTDRVVYVHDYHRGLDVIELLPSPATGTYEATGPVADRALTAAEERAIGLAPFPSTDGPRPRTLTMLVGIVLLAAEAKRRVARVGRGS